MHDAMSSRERYRKEAAEFSDLAKGASSDFVRGNYQRIAEWYLSLAEVELRLAERPKATPVASASERRPEVNGQGEGTWYGSYLKLRIRSRG
jgi:hypothetical protein